MIVLAFQSAIFISYVLYVYSKFGILNSISESYYRINNKLWFTLFCFGLGLPMILHSKAFHPIVATDGDFTGFFFMSMLLTVTGSATNFYNRFTGIIHFVGCLLSVIGAILGIALQYGMMFLPIVWICAMGVCMLLCKRHHIWWMEIVSFALIIISLTFRYLI